jgi:Bacterial TSP3 repeat
MRRLRSQTGQTAAEYLGVLLLVSVVIAGVAHNDIGHRIGCQMRAQVAKILGGDAPRSCGGQSRGPRATASAASASRDSDKDGIPDAEEIRRGTDPYSSDSDHDGVSDKDEIEAGLNPRRADSDGDGLSDGVELDRDSDPFNADTDGDHKSDGEDKDPLHYNASWTDAVKGATCGDSDFLICPDEDDPVRASTEYLTGQLLSGVFAIGDVRDIINALAHGKAGDALWSAVGFVPAAGDAAKFGKKISELIRRFPSRKAELLTVLKKLLPSKFEKAAFDAATGGGYSALQKAGVSTKTIDRLLDRGNDLRKLANNAKLSERTLSSTEAQAIENAVAKHWPASRRSEALGIETALAELKKNPSIDVIFDGRPRPGRPSNGPDIVAVDRSTGRTIVVEAKGTQGQRPLSGRTLRSTAGGQAVTQTQFEWLRNNSGRYLTPLRRSSSAGDQEAARRLADIVNNGGGYDVVIVNSRPAGKGGYGSGVDTATDDIRRSGRVGSLDLIDVQR